MFSSLPRQVLPPFCRPPRVPITALGLSWDSCGLSGGSLYWEVLFPPLGILREYWLLFSLSVLIVYACIVHVPMCDEYVHRCMCACTCMQVSMCHCFLSLEDSLLNF